MFSLHLSTASNIAFTGLQEEIMGPLNCAADWQSDFVPDRLLQPRNHHLRTTADLRTSLTCMCTVKNALRIYGSNYAFSGSLGVSSFIVLKRVSLIVYC